MASRSNRVGLTRRRGEHVQPSEPIPEYDEKEHDQYNLTLMEEVLLLGLKDKEGYTSFWNDCISEGLRGCILVELELRKRTQLEKNGLKRKTLDNRKIEIIDDKLTGEVLLDESLRHIKTTTEPETVEVWVELLSGETWNPMKLKYQLHNVRERLSKSLVEKGVLTTEKQNFFLFDVTTHPVVESSVKNMVIAKVQSALLNKWQSEITKMDPRLLSLVLLAYVSDVLENALISLNDDDYSLAMRHLHDLLDCEPDEECDKENAIPTLWAVMDTFNNQ